MGIVIFIIGLLVGFFIGAITIYSNVDEVIYYILNKDEIEEQDKN